ncbi:hypothetical protein HYU09_00820 [Candidatus Woesearchaeota archaeon]|nr:hypothetical protein [Candidatus Woesearchaeota archaeon]
MNNKRIHKTVSRHKSSIASIVASVVINSLKVSEKTDENQGKGTLDHTAEDESENKEEKPVHGGYGTIKHYAGMSAYTIYANYDKMWGHIGQFIAYGSYRITENENLAAMGNGESTRQMINKETMEKAAKHFKYFVRGEVAGDIGFVPPVGLNIDSGEWEKYRLMNMMSVYRPLLALKRSTA